MTTTQLRLVSSPLSPTSRCPTNKSPVTGLFNFRPGGSYQSWVNILIPGCFVCFIIVNLLGFFLLNINPCVLLFVK